MFPYSSHSPSGPDYTRDSDVPILPFRPGPWVFVSQGTSPDEAFLDTGNPTPCVGRVSLGHLPSVSKVQTGERREGDPGRDRLGWLFSFSGTNIEGTVSRPIFT